MLLDLDAATLTGWVNGERKGVMARPGMTMSSGVWTRVPLCLGWRGRCAGRLT